MQHGEGATYQGYQVCLFPLDYILITQRSGPNTYSHCCGEPCDYKGPYNRYPIYAPCDCHLTYSDNVGNTRGYTSNTQVWTPSGLTYVTFSFTHDNTPPSKTSFTQGELIGYTGTAGFVTGDHTHIDQSLQANARLVSYGVTCQGGNLCYALQGSTLPTNVFYTTGSETIVDTKGLIFQQWKGSPIDPPQPPVPPIGKKFKWWMSKKVLERRKHLKL